MRVIVTRARAQAAPLAAALRAAGHEVVSCPLIEIQPLGDEPIDTSPYDWVILTSANGASEFARRQTGSLGSVAAIGPATAAALRSAGIEPDVVADVSTQEGLAAALDPPPRRSLLAAAEGARQLLVEQLNADFVPLYRTVELRPAAMPEGDLAVVASPSAARVFAGLELALPVVSIGPQTTAAARAAGLEVIAEADRPDVAGVVAAISTLRAW